jgi:23S rRNA (pseudouridine1915-N3)-methyltransferase
MKIKLILVGKTNAKYLVEGEKEYEKRLKHYTKFEEIIIPDVKQSGKLSESELKKKEGQLILAKLENSDHVILLDDKGNSYSSLQFSDFLQQKMNSSLKCLVFVVGGAFGFSDEVYQRANSKVSLSKMTFSHQMIRLIFKEQLYRGFSILRGEKYHHE